MCPKQRFILEEKEAQGTHVALTPLDEIIVYLYQRLEEAQANLVMACSTSNEKDDESLDAVQERLDELGECVCGKNRRKDDDELLDEDESEEAKHQTQVEFLLEWRDQARFLCELIVEVQCGEYTNALAYFEREMNESQATNELIQSRPIHPFWLRHRSIAKCEAIERIAKQLAALATN